MCGGGVSPFLLPGGDAQEDMQPQTDTLWGPPDPSLKPSAPHPLQLPAQCCCRVPLPLKVTRGKETTRARDCHLTAGAQTVPHSRGGRGLPPWSSEKEEGCLQTQKLCCVHSNRVGGTCCQPLWAPGAGCRGSLSIPDPPHTVLAPKPLNGTDL